jgi:hypothetical protein
MTWAGEEVICVMIARIRETSRGRGGIGDDRGILCSSKHGEFAG